MGKSPLYICVGFCMDKFPVYLEGTRLCYCNAMTTLSLEEASKLPLRGALPFWTLNYNSWCPTPSSAFDVIKVLSFSRSDKCAVYFTAVSICNCYWHTRINTLFSASFPFLYPFPWRCLPWSFVCFIISCSLSHCWVLKALCIFWIIALYQRYLLQIFSPNLVTYLVILWHCFCRTEAYPPN